MATDDAKLGERLNVDAIVREVLARIAAVSGAPQAVAPQGTAAKTAASKTTAAPEPSGLVISGRVISARTLEGKLHGVARIVIEPGAVVTPAARDLLRQAKVTIASSVTKSAAAATSSRRVALGVAETKYEPVELARFCRENGVELAEIPRLGLLSVVEDMCDRVARSGELGLLITGAAPAALCLANRQRGVRAALAAKAGDAVAAAKTVGVNLLVVPPTCGEHVLKKIVKEFLSTGGGACPAAYSEALK